MPEHKVRTGGCQCGWIRFRTSGALGRPVVCHCRMCQKHFGSVLSILVAAKCPVQWLGAEPCYFQSSKTAARGFCPRCGTPVSFRTDDGIELAVGTFDDRSDLAPHVHVNHAMRVPWVDQMLTVPVRSAEKDTANQMGIHSLQHPDHEGEP